MTPLDPKTHRPVKYRPWEQPPIAATVEAPAVAADVPQPVQHMDPEHAPVPHAHMDEH